MPVDNVNTNAVAGSDLRCPQNRTENFYRTASMANVNYVLSLVHISAGTRTILPIALISAHKPNSHLLRTPCDKNFRAILRAS